MPRKNEKPETPPTPKSPAVPAGPNTTRITEDNKSESPLPRLRVVIGRKDK